MDELADERSSVPPQTEDRKVLIELNRVCKSYTSGATKTQVLHDINLKIREGEFVAIVGFSGSGKTTLISTIAGLIQPDSGSVLKGGAEIRGPGPDRGVVFQSYSLMPWLTVYDNVALSVDQVFKNWPAAKRKAHTEKYIEMVHLTPALQKRPAELSGGMRQRVSVARALAASPDILLLDEPLSALDALTRSKLQDEILRIWSQERKTVILITNDVDEGIIMADRIIPLNPGPNATLGPDFPVDLPRPRDRTALNHDPEFKKLRRQVTNYLIEVGVENTSRTAGDHLVLPAVRPNTSNDWRTDRSALKPSQEDLGRPRYLEFSQVSKIYPTP
ncbi:MAG: ABC transporter ATP-binding protein, partial [Gammaproteobacteria bacterium]